MKLTPDHVLYHDEIMLWSWSWTSRAGMKAIWQLPDLGSLKEHFVGPETRFRFGKGKTGAFYRLYQKLDRGSFMRHDVRLSAPTFSQERGPRIVVEYSHDEDFMQVWSMPTADQSADQQGAKLMTYIVEIDPDTGEPINQRRRRHAVQVEKGGPKSKSCARMLGDPRFHAWFCRSIGASPLDITQQDMVEHVKARLGVESRAELDHDEGAWDRWEREYRGPFIRATTKGAEG